MQASAPAPVPPPGLPPIARRNPEPDPCLRERESTLGKRRRFIVHRASQLRTALLVTATAALLLTLLNVTLHVARSQATRAVVADSPKLLPILVEQNRFELILGLAASLVFLAGLFTVAILETHRTAGSAFRISLEMARVRDGHYGSRLALRRGDNLKELGQAFNEMSRALVERGAVEAQELEHIASVAARIENPMEAGELAKALRDLADERRKLLVSDASE